MRTELLDLNYTKYVTLLGTAHFTKRSLVEAFEAVRKTKPTDLAIELDILRFQFLNSRCAPCEKRSSCAGRCEFVGATDALGNVSANIWLIDMSEQEIASRIRSWAFHSIPRWFSFMTLPFSRRFKNEVWLWENGYKNEVLERNARRLQILRSRAPHVWRVLIDERNALMAARIGWVVTQKLNKDEVVRCLAVTGAAHIEGVLELLSSPSRIQEELQRYQLRFTPPRLIRRVSVN